MASEYMASEYMASEYNYAIFRGEEDFEAFMGPPHTGTRAPDGLLTDLEGHEVTLSSLWREGHLVIEFGSYT
ncbi:MAG: hypothetical protein IVW57_06810 [Ktedonobacterales bacterium]|nr:hypothetical protein [Ktedonobacterales bacterium]